ncbi:DUF4162 domain-containing protein [Ferrimicrobium sp.]|uniref:ATP-binding protein DrrA1-3 family domain-containing protein n=1 Tax=Ferrimicrobium sp. TaxID=2926050 RepID=UPI0026184CAA|nr:DUF4162 domain-containing protein [Ferrimicrobium sp.]
MEWCGTTVRCEYTERRISSVENLPGVTSVVVGDGELLAQVTGGAAVVPELLKALHPADIAISSLSLSEAILDDVFLSATGRSLRDGSSALSTKRSHQ